MSTTMTPPRKSRTVARELGITYWQLYGLLRGELIPPPGKDDSGEMQWSDEDVDRARAAIAARAARRRGA